jgi:aminopeptidase N
MSTYLVALIVSDFECISGVAKTELSNEVGVSVCARPDAIDQLHYALNVSIRLTEFFESFYQVKYPLPKLDHVAIPDFASGGIDTLIVY